MADIISDFEKQLSQDKTFRNVALAELAVASTLLTKAENSEAIIFLFSATIIFYLMNLLGILWYSIRYEKRYILLESDKKKTVEKYTKKIERFIKEGPIKTARIEVLAESAVLAAEIEKEDLSAIQKAKKFKTKLDFRINKLKQEQKNPKKLKESYVDDVIEAFLINLSEDTRKSYKQFLLQPLINEKYSKIKFIFDISALKLRRPTFYVGNITMLSGVFFIAFS